MGLLVALMLVAVDPSEGTGGASEPPPFTRWGTTLGAGLAHDLEGSSSLWGGLEVSLRPFRWLRFQLNGTAGWVPVPIARYPGAHGPARASFRALAGADFLAPLGWGQFFAGFSAGLEHTNLLYEVFDSGEDTNDRVRFLWFDRWCLVARAGLEVLVSKHVMLGAGLNFAWVGLNGPRLELFARIGFVF